MSHTCAAQEDHADHADNTHGVGHAPRAQTAVSTDAGQEGGATESPGSDVGGVTARERDRVPPPQVAEHADHSLHGETPQERTQAVASHGPDSESA